MADRTAARSGAAFRGFGFWGAWRLARKSLNAVGHVFGSGDLNNEIASSSFAALRMTREGSFAALGMTTGLEPYPRPPNLTSEI